MAGKKKDKKKTLKKSKILGDIKPLLGKRVDS
jgi:hypothetical protein